MNLCNINHGFNYELEKLSRIFMPYEKINILNEVLPAEVYAVCEIDGKMAKATLFAEGKSYEQRASIEGDTDKDAELTIASCLYKCFSEATGYSAEWGLLTGVRPAKLYSRMLISDGREATDQYFSEKLFVSDEKIRLCAETVGPEEDIVSKSGPDSFSLYISVPFCPSRCSYCSFVSHSVDKAGKLVGPYVDLLCEEIKSTGEIAKDLSLKLETVYIGGGTPVALNAEQLTRVMSAIRENFDLEGILEYTVEAGRPDAITEDKLIAIKKGGATRISVNPQTMNDSVLRAIGRNHNAKQTEDAFLLAREVGFDNINMDLIAGLPTDTADSFKKTLDTVLLLDPESVTVHSLSVKKASTISTSGAFPDTEVGKTASEMVKYAKKVLADKDILPYYMYRQSKTVGNLENVGYAKKGYEGLYNVYIMDETHTILACGASGVTKLREPNGPFIDRIYNFKYPYEYISRFDEIIGRKSGIKEFYSKYK